MSTASDLLRATALRKSFTTPVLVDFGFSLRRGEVHALVGGNGAGKSTFARILGGLTPPDAGSLELDARSYRAASRRAAERAGVLLVAQELTIIPTLSAAENVFFTRLPRRAGFVRGRELADAA